MKKQFVLFFLLGLFGCSETPSTSEQKTVPNKEDPSAQNANAELQAAVALAEKGDSKGLLKLYEIFTNDPTYGVEFSEVAKEKLDHFLFLKTDLWVSTFSEISPESFQWKKISAVDMPAGIEEEKFEQQIKENLKKFKGTPKEMKFAASLLEQIGR